MATVKKSKPELRKKVNTFNSDDSTTKVIAKKRLHVSLF
jgi:hypothetical protein